MLPNPKVRRNLYILNGINESLVFRIFIVIPVCSITEWSISALFAITKFIISWSINIKFDWSITSCSGITHSITPRISLRYSTWAPLVNLVECRNLPSLFKDSSCKDKILKHKVLMQVCIYLQDRELIQAIKQTSIQGSLWYHLAFFPFLLMIN